MAAFWDGFQRHHTELSGEPLARGYESIWIFDPQVGGGYANAGRLRINYPLHAEAWVLSPGTVEGREYIATLPELGPQPYVIPPSTGYSPSAHGVNCGSSATNSGTSGRPRTGQDTGSPRSQ